MISGFPVLLTDAIMICVFSKSGVTTVYIGVTVVYPLTTGHVPVTSGVGSGLQIRVHRFDSGTRLQLLVSTDASAPNLKTRETTS